MNPIAERLIAAPKAFPPLVKRTVAEASFLQQPEEPLPAFYERLGQAKRIAFAAYLQVLADGASAATQTHRDNLTELVATVRLAADGEAPEGAAARQLRRIEGWLRSGVPLNLVAAALRLAGQPEAFGGSDRPDSHTVDALGPGANIGIGNGGTDFDNAFWAQTKLLDTGAHDKIRLLFLQLDDWPATVLSDLLGQVPDLRIVFYSYAHQALTTHFDRDRPLDSARMTLLPLHLWSRAIGYIEVVPTLFAVPQCAILEEILRYVSGQWAMCIVRSGISNTNWEDRLGIASPCSLVASPNRTNKLQSLLPYRLERNAVFDNIDVAERAQAAPMVAAKNATRVTQSELAPVQLEACFQILANSLSHGSFVLAKELGGTTKALVRLMRSRDVPFRNRWIKLLAHPAAHRLIAHLVKRKRWEMLASSPFYRMYCTERHQAAIAAEGVADVAASKAEPEKQPETSTEEQKESDLAVTRDPNKRFLVADLSRKSDTALVKTAKEYWSPLKLAKLFGEMSLHPASHDAFSILRKEFPWMAALTDELARQLHRAASLGTGYFKIRPLLLIGEPGGGKTRYATRLAELTGLGFRLIAAGGGSDNRNLTGTARGWGTTNPSAVVDLIAGSGMANPLVLVDEIDKCGESRHNGRISDTLLQMLEPVNARTFHDECLQMNVDISYVNWILTANSLTGIPKPLLSRVQIVQTGQPGPEHMPGLIYAVRTEIARAHGVHPALVPELDGDETAIVSKAGDAREAARIVQRLIDNKLSAAIDVVH